MINNSSNPSPIHFQPIGIIQTEHLHAAGTPIQPTAAKDCLGKIILNPELVIGLQDLDGFSHIILLYFLDRIKNSKLLVKPFMDDTERGVFATRAPSRPNPIGLSVVKLIRIEGNIITFSGADMLNNTPLLDIKPYVPLFDPPSVEKIGWLQHNSKRLENSQDDGRFLD